MKIKLIILYILFNFNLFSQNKKSDIIIWTDTTYLKLKDFTKVDPNKKLPGQAGSTVKFDWKDTCINNQVYLRLNCWFSRSKSWLVKGNENNLNLLKHEQLHFDLLEVYARLCKRKIAFMNRNCANRNEIVSVIFEYYKLQNEENLKYDKETAHGTIKLKQKEWNDKIRKQLKELEKYK